MLPINMMVIFFPEIQHLMILIFIEFLQCQVRNDDRRVKTTNETIGGTISNLKTPARRQFFVQ